MDKNIYEFIFKKVNEITYFVLISIIAICASPAARAASTQIVPSTENIKILPGPPGMLDNLKTGDPKTGSRSTAGAGNEKNQSVSSGITADLDAGFSVDPTTGAPRLSLPIEVGKGTNLTPGLALSFDGRKASSDATSAWSIAGAEPITTCFAAQGLCLGDLPLIPVQGAKDGSLYRLADDPLTLLRQTVDGYELSTPSGETRYFTATPNKSKNWRLQHAADTYGNFITYSYLSDTNWPTNISYGPKGAAKDGLRVVSFTYDLTNTAKLTNITSMIGDHTVKNYNLSYDGHGNPLQLSTCAMEPDKTVSCKSVYQFDWLTTGNSSPVLHLARNSLGGTVNIEYLDGSNGTVVSSNSMSSGENVVGEIQYYYDNPILGKSGKTAGYEKVATYNPISDKGVMTTYGTGNLAGKILSTSMFNLKEKKFSFSSVDPILTQTNTYEEINTNAGSIYLVSQTEDAARTQSGTYETLGKKAYKYDSSGRIISLSENDTETQTAYQDNDTLLGLVSAEKVIDLKTKATLQTSEWAYEFANNSTSQVKITIDDKLNASKAAVGVFKFDTFGNVTSISTGEKLTTFTYDKMFHVFPTSIVWILQDGKKRWSNFEYDPASGEIIRLENELGNIVTSALDEFGSVRTITTTTKLPADEDNNSPSFMTETVERLESRDENGDTILTEMTSLKLNTETAPYYTQMQKSAFDGMGRLVRLDTQTKSGPKDAVNSTIRKSYRDMSETTFFTLPDGTSLEQEKDQFDRLVRQKDAVRGEIAYAYTADGLIASISRNGEKVSFEYDEQNRIKTRLLPDGGKYMFEYDELFTERPAVVTLPDGAQIKYAYYTDGSRKSKTVALMGPDNKPYEFKTQFTYKNAQLSSITYPDGSQVAYNFNGPILTDISWSKGAPKNWKSDTNKIVTYDSSVEDGANLVLVRKLNNGVIDRRIWNNIGQLTHLTAIGSNGKTLLDMDYGIDNNTGQINRANRLQGDQSLAKRYQYDDQAHLAAIESQLYKTQENSSFEQNKQTNSFTYNDVGSILTDEKGLRTYKLENTQNYRTVSRSDGMQFTYDANGNLIKKNMHNYVSEFEFDALSQLRSAKVTKDGNTVVTSMTYDDAGNRLIKKIGGESTTAYIDRFYEVTWNEDGSVQQTKYVPDPVMIVASFTETLSQDELQQFIPATTKASGAGNNTTLIADLSSFGQSTLTELKLWLYSRVSPTLIATIPLVLIGLITFFMLLSFETFIRRYQGREDDDGNLLGLSHETSVKTTFVRNHYGMAAVAPFVIFSFLFSSLVPTVQAAILDGQGIPQPNSANYYHEDANGSVLLVTDSKGEPRASVDYSAYGLLNNNGLTNGKDTFRRKFARMEYDKSIGLYYDHARYYDPDTGRFISPDPSNASDDPYNYAGSDPVNFFDPDGRMLEPNELRNLDGSQAQNDMDIINEHGNYGNRPLNPYRQLLRRHQDEDPISAYDAEYSVANEPENETAQNYTFVPPTFWRFWWKYVKKPVQTVVASMRSPSQSRGDGNNNETEIMMNTVSPKAQNIVEDEDQTLSLRLSGAPIESNIRRNNDDDKDEQKRLSLSGVSDEDENLLQDINLNNEAPKLDVFFDEDRILYTLLKRIRLANINNDNPHAIDNNILALVSNDAYLSIQNAKKRYNKLARRTVKSFSSTGVLAFTSLAAFVSAYYWPYYNAYEDDPNKQYCAGGADDFEWGCYFKEVGLNLGVILIFSGVAKTYYYLEAAYWGANALSTRTDETGCWPCKTKGRLVKEPKNATAKDYVKFSIRRLTFAVGSQMVGFNILGIIAQQARFGQWLTAEQLMWLNVGWFTTSLAGNIAWLPIFMMLRNPSDDNQRAIKIVKARELNLQNSEYKNSNWADKFTFQYRQFLTGKYNMGAWMNWLDLSETNWQYFLRSLQFYVQYNIANISFYGGYTTAILIDKNLDFNFWRYVLASNVLRANMAVNSGLFCYITKIPCLNRSFKIAKQRTPNNPRKYSEPMRFLLGPFDGVRIFQYDDTDYLPEQLWRPNLKKLEVHRLKVILTKYFKENPSEVVFLSGVSDSSDRHNYQPIPDPIADKKTGPQSPTTNKIDEEATIRSPLVGDKRKN